MLPHNLLSHLSALPKWHPHSHNKQSCPRLPLAAHFDRHENLRHMSKFTCLNAFIASPLNKSHKMMSITVHRQQQSQKQKPY